MGGIIYETYNEENGKPWTGCCHIVDNAGWLWKQQRNSIYDGSGSDFNLNLLAFDALDGSVDTAGEKDLLTRLELGVQLLEVLLLLLHVDLRPDGVNQTHDDKQA